MSNEQKTIAEALLDWDLTGEPVDLGVLEALSGPGLFVVGTPTPCLTFRAVCLAESLAANAKCNKLVQEARDAGWTVLD